MKKILLTSVLAVLVALGTTVRAQEYPDEYLGLPGDNLNLYAVMKLFQESETIEAFERNLNEENTRINNLDLNGDNFVDYIMVSDYVDGEVHSIVLRVALDKNDFQDVAVFTVQKFRNGSVQIQLIGDEALYGKNYIVEPNYAETPNPGYMGKPKRNITVNVVYTSYWEVAEWPMVRYIYMPGYNVWHSSWYWGYYPPYWRPWHSCYWHYYYGYHYNWYYHYYRHYRHWDQPRWNGYYDFYYAGHHSQSPKVYEHINKGTYNTTYSRPDQRREGEVLFTSMHPTQEKRTDQNTPVISQRRSSASQMTRTETSTRTTSATTRRSDNVTTSRSSSDPSTRSTTTATRRPATYVNERPAAKSTVEDAQAPVRRSSAVEPEREVYRSEPAKSETEYRREPEPVRERVISRPEPVQERVISRPEPAREEAEYRRPEPVQERVESRPAPVERAAEVRRDPEPARREEAPRASQPAPSQPERKPAVESKSEPSERRTEKPQRPDETEQRIR